MYNGLWIVQGVTQREDTASAVATLTTGAVVGADVCYYPHGASFNCNASGISPVVSAGDEFSHPALDFLRVFYLYLPPVEQLVIGYSWAGDSYEDVHRGGGLSEVQDTRLETYTVTGADPIVINEQMYEGLQITKVVTSIVSGCSYIPIRSQCDPGPHTSEYAVTYTLARGIGILLLEYDGSVYDDTVIYLDEFGLP